MESKPLICVMTNTDNEFYDKIDKRMQDILSLSQQVSPNIRGEYNYIKDKEKGDKGEEFLRGFIEKNGCVFVRASTTENDEHKEFDHLYLYNGKEIKYEFKTDMYPDTGNLVVEFEDRGKPSGISVTKADYFMTYFPKLGEIWNIKTSNLKKLIADSKFKIVPGGDGKKAKMHQIPRKKFREHFKVHNVH